MLGLLGNLPPILYAVRAFPSLFSARSLNYIALYECESINARNLELPHYSPRTVICNGTVSTNMNWCLQQYHNVGNHFVRSGQFKHTYNAPSPVLRHDCIPGKVDINKKKRRKSRMVFLSDIWG